jgi:hypothetical protein
MSRATGLCGAKGGSMHLTVADGNMLGSYAIVGSHLPIACGAAWSAKLRGSGQVAVAFFGDGATNIGAFHEALNLAAVWKLPALFVCENNLLDKRYTRTFHRAPRKTSPNSRSSMTRPPRGRRSNVGSGRAQPSFPLYGKRPMQRRRAHTTKLNGRRHTFLQAQGGAHVAP